MKKVALILFKYSVNINDPCCYPLGFMYVSSWLKNQGYTVDVYNENIGNSYIDFKIYDEIYMTGFEEFLPRIKVVAEHCKKLNIKTILGGALATFRTNEMLEIVDEVIIGEIDNIEDDILPDYEGFGIEKYHDIHNLKYMGVLTSRGCPHSCTFCAHTCKFKERPLSEVFKEIKHYQDKYNVSYIVFNDNTLNVRKSRYLDICKFMKKQGLKWSAAIRVDCFDEEMAIATKESGGVYFVVGIESFSQFKLDKMNKKIEVEQIHKTLKLLHKHDIDYHGNIIVGMDDDTIESIAIELEEMPKEYKIFPVLAQPFVGTKVTTKLTKDERTILNTILTEYAENNGMEVFKGL